MSANVIARIDSQISELSPETIRCMVLVSLRNFRVSWVELGKLLTDVAYGGDYKEWGYEDFEAYCASELGLKKMTVKKLMVSYNYMKSYEPEKVRAAIESKSVTLPDYQTIDELKKFREDDYTKPEEIEEMHRLAFDSSTDQSTLRREIKARKKASALFNREEIDAANFNYRKEIRSILRTSRTLRQRVGESRCLPAGVKERIEEVLCELEALE